MASRLKCNTTDQHWDKTQPAEQSIQEPKKEPKSKCKTEYKREAKLQQPPQKYSATHSVTHSAHYDTGKIPKYFFYHEVRYYLPKLGPTAKLSMCKVIIHIPHYQFKVTHRKSLLGHESIKGNAFAIQYCSQTEFSK